jgi:hypothetical protein
MSPCGTVRFRNNVEGMDVDLSYRAFPEDHHWRWELSCEHVAAATGIALFGASK